MTTASSSSLLTGFIQCLITGRLNWERVPSKSEKNSECKSWFTVEKDSIRIKTKTFSQSLEHICVWRAKEEESDSFFKQTGSQQRPYLLTILCLQ